MDATVTTITTIATSPWFALIGGLASILGCLLAVYPVQVAQIPPSVYRGMVWQKALLWSCGLGLMVLAGIQFYVQAPPSDSLFGPLHNIIHGRPLYGQAGLSQANQANTGAAIGVGLPGGHGVQTGTSTYNPGGNAKQNTPVVSDPSSGGGSSPTNPSSGSGASPPNRSSSGGSSPINPSSGSGASPPNPSPSNAGGNAGGDPIDTIGTGLQSSVGNINTTVGIPSRAYGTAVWGILFFLGCALFVVGISDDPYKHIEQRIEELEKTLSDKRSDFLKSIAALDQNDRAIALEKYDRRADLMQDLLLGILTGQSVSPLRALGQHATYADLLSTAATLLSSSQRPRRSSDEDETKARTPTKSS